MEGVFLMNKRFINILVKKLLLFLLLATHVTVPMEQQFFNASQQSFCPALTGANNFVTGNAAMPMGRQPLSISDFSNIVTGEQIIMLTMHAFGLAKLIKNNCLFGTRIMRKFDDREEMMFYILDTYWPPMLAVAFNPIMDSRLYMLRVIGSLVYMSNVIYQKAMPVELITKDQVDIAVLPDAKCLVCWDDESDKEYVNLCEQEDHIFCKECLTVRFNAQKDKSKLVHGYSFFCDACHKDVPFNHDKFEVGLSTTKVTPKLWIKYVDVHYRMYFLTAIFTFGMMLHSYLFEQ